MQQLLFASFRLRSAILTAGLILLILGFISPLLGQTSSSTGSAEKGDFLDRVHQGDVIEIRVPGYIDYDWRGRLNPEGFLDGFDKIATPIYAQCKSLGELEAAVDKLLSEILRAPKTEVKFVDRSKRQLATIDGAVRNPQRMQIRRSIRLSEVIVNAGGLTDRASGQLIISRPAGASCVNESSAATSQRFDIAVADLLAGKADADPTIVSGDLIVVIEASPVFLLGAVQGQGRIDFRSDLTVSRAIDSAGGLAKNANAESVKIFRREGGSSIIQVDLERIRDKRDEDVVLRPFDIIDVPSKGKPPRRLPPVLENDIDISERRAKLPIKIIE